MRTTCLGAAIALAASLFAATAANATTMLFEFDSGGTTVANGSFSYADGTTGVVTLGDLTDFSLNMFGDSYDLADFQGFTKYVNFNYDTSDNEFVTETFATKHGSIESVLSGLNSTFTSGFFFSAGPGGCSDYKINVGAAFDNVLFDAEPTGGAAPEPATWAMLLLGFFGLGAVLRASRRASSALAA